MWSDATARLLKANAELPREEHRAQLRNRVTELQEEILAIHSFQNTLAPAALLPFEILSAIFLICRASEKRTIGSPWKETLRWIYPTHVCRRWRDAAIGCAVLWSDLSFSNPEFTEVMLQRSRGAPLTVEWWDDDNWDVHKIVSELLKQPERLRNVDIRIVNLQESGPAMHPIISSLSGRAPLLEHLCLRAYGCPQNVIPLNLLEGGATALKRLDIHGFNITNWLALPSGLALTHLAISLRGGAAEFNRPRIREFYGYLLKLPYLRSLSLHDCLPVLHQEAKVSHDTPRLKFPALETLDIGDTVELLADFFAAVELPRAKSLILFVIDSRTPDAVSELLAQLPASWREGMGGQVGRLKLYEDDQPLPELSFDFLNQARLELSFGGQTPTVDELMSVCRDRLDMTTLESLEVRETSEFEVGIPSWEAFSSLRHLKYIRFYRTDAVKFAVVFRQEPVVADDEEELGFAALSELRFDGVHFGLRRGMGGPGPVENITEGLKWREAREKQIRALHIHRCSHFSNVHYNEIREKAPGLETCWDNVQMRSGWDGIYHSD